MREREGEGEKEREEKIIKTCSKNIFCTYQPLLNLESLNDI